MSKYFCYQGIVTITQNITEESLSQSILVICTTVQTNNGAQSGQTAFDELPRGGLRRTTKHKGIYKICIIKHERLILGPIRVEILTQICLTFVEIINTYQA